MGDEVGNYGRALSLIGSGAYATALDVLRQVASAEPHHPQVKLALLELARRSAQRGYGLPPDSNEAAADFRVALDAFRATDESLTDAQDQYDIASINFRLGARCQQIGQSDNAAGFYRESLAIDPTGADAALNIASILLLAGRPQELVELLRPALAAHPANQGLHRNLIFALFELGRNAEATAAIVEAGRRFPDMRFQYAGHFYRSRRAGSVVNA